MKLVKNILNLFKKKFSDPFTNADWKIEPAFESGGVQYYMFADPFNIPAERALQSITFYREMEMGVTRDELLKWVNKVDEILNPPQGKPIKIGEIALITTVLKQKLDFLAETDLFWRIGSVVFFDKSENPGRFDYKYAGDKVARWKQDMTIDVFFSLSRMYKWIPSLNTSRENILTYLKQVEEITKEHSAILSQISSSGHKTQERAKSSL